MEALINAFSEQKKKRMAVKVTEHGLKIVVGKKELKKAIKKQRKKIQKERERGNYERSSTDDNQSAYYQQKIQADGV